MAKTSGLSAGDAVNITPSDVDDHNLNGIYVGGTGNVNVVTDAGTTVLFSACPVGTKIELLIKRVKSTSTTATLIVGFRS